MATQSSGLTINKGLSRQLFNRFVTAVLSSPLHSLFGFSSLAMLLTYTGKKSGKSYTLPLAYIREGDTITTFALFTNTVWWKNLLGKASVVVRLGGKDYTATGEAITDPQEVAEALLRMNTSNPQMTSRGYYALPRTASGEVDRTALLEEARTRVMISIQLQSEVARNLAREV